MAEIITPMGQGKDAETIALAFIVTAATVRFSPAAIACTFTAVVVVCFQGDNRHGNGEARAERAPIVTDLEAPGQPRLSSREMQQIVIDRCTHTDGRLELERIIFFKPLSV